MNTYNIILELIKSWNEKKEFEFHYDGNSNGDPTIYVYNRSNQKLFFTILHIIGTNICPQTIGTVDNPPPHISFDLADPDCEEKLFAYLRNLLFLSSCHSLIYRPKKSDTNTQRRNNETNRQSSGNPQ